MERDPYFVEMKQARLALTAIFEELMRRESASKIPLDDLFDNDGDELFAYKLRHNDTDERWREKRQKTSHRL